MSPSLTRDEIAQLRRKHYNAAVTVVRHVHDELMVVRVRPDGGVPEYQAGQFTTLGLGYWEPRAPDTQEEQLSEGDLGKVVTRAYSISFPILDDAGKLLRRAECDFLEFYVVLVRDSSGAPPARTHVFLCGNPGMIGIPHTEEDGSHVYPKPRASSKSSNGAASTPTNAATRGTFISRSTGRRS
ncbi:MAG: hypothetical protein ACM3U2_01570 [Deltaproteobacteria bacterium]